MKSRPAQVRILKWMTLFFTIYHVIRFVVSVLHFGYLNEFASSYVLVYISTSGMIWSLCGIVSLVKIMGRQPGTHLILSGMSTGYAIWWWLDHLLIQRNGQNSFGFNSIITFILLGIVLILSLNHGTIAYFRQKSS
jgi:hypothetical protein